MNLQFLSKYAETNEQRRDCATQSRAIEHKVREDGLSDMCQAVDIFFAHLYELHNNNMPVSEYAYETFKHLRVVMYMVAHGLKTEDEVSKYVNIDRPEFFI